MALFTGAQLALAHMVRCRFKADELVSVGAVAPSPHYCGSGPYDEASPSCVLLPFTSQLHPGLIVLEHLCGL